MITLSTTIQSLGFVSCYALHLHRSRRMNEVLGDVSGGDQSGGRRRKNPAQQDGYRDREAIEKLKLKFKKLNFFHWNDEMRDFAIQYLQCNFVTMEFCAYMNPAKNIEGWPKNFKKMPFFGQIFPFLAENIFRGVKAKDFFGWGVKAKSPLPPPWNHVWFCGIAYRTLKKIKSIQYQ